MPTIDRTQPPKINANFHFKLQKPTICKLENGMGLYYFENQNLNLIHFTVRVKAGSLFETEKGISRATYLLLQESAKDKSAAEVEDFLSFWGSSFEVAVSQEFVSLNFVIPKTNCEQVLPFIFDFIRFPAFDEDVLLHYKKRKLKELEYHRSTTSYCAEQMIYTALVNQDIPAGKILENADINALTVEKLTVYHARTFCSENTNIFIAGNYDLTIMNLLKCFCNTIPSFAATCYPSMFTTKNAGKQLVDTKENTVQSSIRICRTSFDYQHPDRRNFSILNTLLGGYFGSRLMKNLREDKGLTYGIYSGCSYFGDGSIFYLSTDVNVNHTQEAIEECKKEMQKLCNEIVSNDELLVVKQYLQGSLLRKVDGTVDYMRNYMLWQCSGLDETEQEEMMQAIEEVTPEMLYQLASQYLNIKDFTIIISGQCG
ncbi:MAG: insulinase family protein [Bacteroidales bacterium]|jgi:predicted Zn-dependent peptidase|nr:insulinase family protein [Bacteroidales bacterium]